MRSRRPGRIASLIVAVAVLATLGTPGAAAERKVRRYTVAGSIRAAGLQTHMEFIFTCPYPPKTQGIGAYVVDVPPAFREPRSTVNVVHTAAASMEPDIELSFYSSDCDQVDLLETPPVTMPPDIAFIVVEDTNGAVVDFELTLTQRSR